jgi:DNA-binding MarR family transcriptional regulator
MKDPVSAGVTSLLVAGMTLSAQLEAVYARFGLTASAFDVLRILRADPQGQSRAGIAKRLLSRAPDVTRLIDRLEHHGLVRRVRTRSDRRLSITRITPKGADLVTRVEPVLESFRMQISPRLSDAEWKELSRLCEQIRGAGSDPASQR